MNPISPVTPTGPRDPHPQGLEQPHPNLVLGVPCRDAEPWGHRGAGGGGRGWGAPEASGWWAQGHARAPPLSHPPQALAQPQPPPHAAAGLRIPGMVLWVRKAGGQPGAAPRAIHHAQPAKPPTVRGRRTFPWQGGPGGLPVPSLCHPPTAAACGRPGPGKVSRPFPGPCCNFH